ncbi:hypothetical protein CCH79_00014270 [Gambusia affinis]|uniref:Uncharacterized protein n=1 Tax=Gambusia affinis TaxID=33528 RepID=A0A315UUL4_GAMAF|nr:hypothetical protein CCH79_00014270 [Gambusia affinis]
MRGKATEMGLKPALNSSMASSRTLLLLGCVLQTLSRKGCDRDGFHVSHFVALQRTSQIAAAGVKSQLFLPSMAVSLWCMAVGVLTLAQVAPSGQERNVVSRSAPWTATRRNATLARPSWTESQEPLSLPRVHDAGADVGN